MDDSRRPPLADDPHFLDGLSDLDRGLDNPELPPGAPPSKPVAPPVHADHEPVGRAAGEARHTPVTPPPPTFLPPREQLRPQRRLPLPPSLTSPFDAMLDPPAAPASQTSSPPLDASARRPLVDLFPPVFESSDEGSLPARKREALADASTPADDYETHYALSEPPFALSTDPRFFYHSAPHDLVAQRLLTAVRKREGLVVVTGDIGAGKTMLCRTIVEQLDRRTLSSFVTHPFLSGEELLKTVLADFGVMSRDELSRGPLATRHELSTTLQSFVESLATLDASALVIIDEAQDLPPDVLEQVRILNEAAEATSLLQVVLVGQPSLSALLRRPEYKMLHQRVTVRAILGPLPADEIGAYVMHRLAVAGNDGRITFDEPALARIFQLSQGLPRVVNLICDRALARGCEASAKTIDRALVEAAAEDLDLAEPRSSVRAAASRAVVVAALVLCALAGAALAAWIFRDPLSRAIGRWRGVPAQHAPVSPITPRQN